MRPRLTSLTKGDDDGDIYSHHRQSLLRNDDALIRANSLTHRDQVVYLEDHADALGGERDL